MTFAAAMEQVKRMAVFTTHTPVPAGNDIFPRELMDNYFSEYYGQLGIDADTFYELGRHPCEAGRGFNMSAFALKLPSTITGYQRSTATLPGPCGAACGLIWKRRIFPSITLRTGSIYSRG